MTFGICTDGMAGIIATTGQCTRLMKESMAVTHFDIVITSTPTIASDA